MVKIGVDNKHKYVSFRRLDILVFHFEKCLLERKFLSPPFLELSLPQWHFCLCKKLVFRAYTDIHTKVQVQNCRGASGQ